MFHYCFPLIVLAAITGFNLAGLPGGQDPVRTPEQNPVKSAPVPRTVQILVDADVDLLVQNSDGKRTGMDFKTRKFVNELPEARVISREASTSYVLPFDKPDRPYTVIVTGKSPTRIDASLSVTGPGFVAGFRNLPLMSGQPQQMTFASNGLHLSLTANQDGPTPLLFLATQAGRGKPSYRFEVTSSLLMAGKTITLDLDTDKGRLYFKTDDPKRDNFSAKMRRTNPGGTRDMFAHQDISFGKMNSYAMDFGRWEGQGEMCFYEVCASCKENECTKLGNESSPGVTSHRSTHWISTSTGVAPCEL